MGLSWDLLLQVPNAYPQIYHAFVAVGLGVVLLLGVMIWDSKPLDLVFSTWLSVKESLKNSMYIYVYISSSLVFMIVCMFLLIDIVFETNFLQRNQLTALGCVRELCCWFLWQISWWRNHHRICPIARSSRISYHNICFASWVMFSYPEDHGGSTKSWISGWLLARTLDFGESSRNTEFLGLSRSFWDILGRPNRLTLIISNSHIFALTMTFYESQPVG